MDYVEEKRKNIAKEMTEADFTSARILLVADAINISRITAQEILKEQLELWKKVEKKVLITPGQERRRIAMCEDILKRGAKKFGDNFYDNIIFTYERYKYFHIRSFEN
jgi:hypothetical protein